MMRAAGRKGKMRAGRLSESPDHAAHRSARARVYYALFTLLRLLTLHCTRKRSVAEGEKAHQTEKGVADDPTRSPADPGDFRPKAGPIAATGTVPRGSGGLTGEKSSLPIGISSSGRQASRRSSHRNNLGNGSSCSQTD